MRRHKKIKSAQRKKTSSITPVNETPDKPPEIELIDAASPNGGQCFRRLETAGALSQTNDSLKADCFLSSTEMSSTEMTQLSSPEMTGLSSAEMTDLSSSETPSQEMIKKVKEIAKEKQRERAPGAVSPSGSKGIEFRDKPLETLNLVSRRQLSAQRNVMARSDLYTVEELINLKDKFAGRTQADPQPQVSGRTPIARYKRRELTVRCQMGDLDKGASKLVTIIPLR